MTALQKLRTLCQSALGVWSPRGLGDWKLLPRPSPIEGPSGRGSAWRKQASWNSPPDHKNPMGHTDSLMFSYLHARLSTSEYHKSEKQLLRSKLSRAGVRTQSIVSIRVWFLPRAGARDHFKKASRGEPWSKVGLLSALRMTFQVVSSWKGLQRFSSHSSQVASPILASSSFCCPPASGKLTSHCFSLFLVSGLDSLPPNQEATLSIPRAHSHTYRTSMWCKVPSIFWPINIASKFG